VCSVVLHYLQRLIVTLMVTILPDTTELQRIHAYNERTDMSVPFAIKRRKVILCIPLRAAPIVVKP
jgi:hypothetical protein